MGFAETSALVEGGVIEVVRFDAEAGGDVAADEFEPGALVGVEGGSGFRLLREPAFKAGGDRFGKGFQHRLLFEGEADERHEVSEAVDDGAALHLARRGGGKGLPERFLVPGGVSVAEFALQFLEHRFGQALTVGAAVEDLQGGDLGVVLLDIVTEGFHQAGSLLLRGGVETLHRDFVDCCDVDDLLGFLLGLGEIIAQSGTVEGLASLGDEFLPGFFHQRGGNFIG